MSELIEYHQQLLDQSNISAEANGSIPAWEFYSFATSLLADEGIIDDISEEGSFHHYNPNYGTKLDGWGWNELEKTLYGIAVNFNEDPKKIKPINKSDLEKIGKRVAKLFNSIDNENFRNSIGYDDAARLDEIREHFEHAIKFRIVILTNQQTTARMKNTGFSIENILDKKTRIEVWDIEKIMSLDLGGTDSAPVEIDFVELFGSGIEALQADVNPNVKSYLCVLPGEYLSKIYDIYGQRILQSNVRSFLNFTMGTNKGMRNTLLLEPEKFFSYNNGLTVTASHHKIKKEGGKLLITDLHNMQIVNGGQTTGAIYFSPQDKGGPRSDGKNYLWKDIDLSKVFVQMKLTIIDDEEQSPVMTQNISRYSNTQTKVNEDDLISNEPLHLRIEKISRKTYVRPDDGVPTKWFYERSRGQYNVLLRRQKTDAKKRTFQQEYPKKQLFKKTDMMKYENTWRMNPHSVVKGPTFNSKSLNPLLKKQWENNDNDFREPFFYDLISKAILFKDLDDALGSWLRKNQLTGHKAQTITYSIAYLRRLLILNNQSINLKRIYDNQSVSDGLLSEMLKLAIHVRETLMDEAIKAGVGNADTFAKRKQCWETIRNMPYDLSIPDEDLLNMQQIEDNKSEKAKIAVAGEHIASFNKVLGINQNEWVELSDYLQNEENLPYDHKKVQIVQKCILMHQTQGVKAVTEKQAKVALEILEDAIKKDFNYVR